MEDVSGRISAGSRLLRCFLSVLQENFPHVSETGRTYLLRDSLLHWFPGPGHGNEALADLYERSLISLFDSKSLLNMETGGSHFDFIPPIKE